MTRRLLLAPLALAACVATASPEAVVTDVTTRVFPGMSTAPVLDCVRQHASPDEYASLGRLTTGEAQVLILQILARPETTACLGARGITIS